MADTTEVDRKRDCDDETSLADTELAAKKPRTDPEDTTMSDGAPESKEAPQPDETLVVNSSQSQEENGNADGGDEGDEDAHDEGDAGDDDSTAAVNGNGHQGSKVTEAKVGPKLFKSEKEMFLFFLDLLRTWPVYHNFNKYEHLVLEDLLLKGHHDPQAKIGAGIEAFQVRINPNFNTRCYYVIRKDGSFDDFSFKKCVNTIMPLPEEYMKSTQNRGHDKHSRGHGGGRGHHNHRNRGGRFGGRGRGGGRGGGHRRS